MTQPNCHSSPCGAEQLTLKDDQNMPDEDSKYPLNPKGVSELEIGGKYVCTAPDGTGGVIKVDRISDISFSNNSDFFSSQYHDIN